jgi:arylsulfatase A-like enzyme
MIILTDDQAQNTFNSQLMPRTFHEIVGPGTRFPNGIAAPPLCCPDRAGILTGQYPHDHGVFSNHPGYAELRDPGNVLPVWLHRAGYFTGFVGKYLNNYSSVGGVNTPPGYDFSAFVYGDPSYYDYSLAAGGVVHDYGDSRSDYLTRVLTRKARGFLARAATRTHPFFLWLAYYAPHIEKTPDHMAHCANAAQPPDLRSYRAVHRLALPTTPAFNEQDVSDKPPYVSHRQPLGPKAIHHITDAYRCAAASIESVDRGIGSIVRTLRARHELANTVIWYVSDNGFLYGEHRIPHGKGQVYEPSLNVPMALRLGKDVRGARRAPHRVGKVVSNQDIAPTLLGYAGGAPPCSAAGHCRRMDGRNLRHLLEGRSRSFPTDRGVLVELPNYTAIRTKRWVYEEMRNGWRELYDLRSDPFELQNLAGDPNYSGVQAWLATRLASLRRCSGISGRDPARTGAPFCE